MKGDKHFGVVRINPIVYNSAMKEPEKVQVPAEFREELVDRRRQTFLSNEGNAFMECLMQMIAKDIKELGPDFDMSKWEIEISATLQPLGTNKLIPVES